MSNHPKEAVQRVELRDVLTIPEQDRCEITLRDWAGDKVFRLSMADADKLQYAIWLSTKSRMAQKRLKT